MGNAWCATRFFRLSYNSGEELNFPYRKDHVSRLKNGSQPIANNAVTLEVDILFYRSPNLCSTNE